MNFHTFKQDISDYYSKKIQTYGSVHQGVDWNSEESQWLRFEQLLRGFQLSLEQPFLLNDYGCGYGAMIDYLATKALSYHYIGYDLSQDMVESAKRRYAENREADFRVGDDLSIADYTIASGIFNVKLDKPKEDWEAYIRDCLLKMHKASERGFSFNILTSYSDLKLQREDLYYADPTVWFDFCKRHFSRHVALFHDYDLYEFTISVCRIQN